MHFSSKKSVNTRVTNQYEGLQRQVNYSEMNYNKRTNLLYCNLNNENNYTKKNRYLSQGELLEVKKIKQTICPSGCDVLPFNKGSMASNLVTVMDLSGVVILSAVNLDPITGGKFGEPSPIPTYLNPAFIGNIWRNYWVDPFNNIISPSACNQLVYTQFMVLDPELFPSSIPPTYPTFKGIFSTTINNETYDPSNIPQSGGALYPDPSTNMNNPPEYSTEFGSSVEFSPDNKFLAISAPDLAVYIFPVTGNTISNNYSITLSITGVRGTNYGSIIEWSHDSSTLAVTASTLRNDTEPLGASYGAVYLYDSSNNFAKSASPVILYPDITTNSTGLPLFGNDISWHKDSYYIAVGAPKFDSCGYNTNGIVFIFDKYGTLIYKILEPISVGAQLGTRVSWCPLYDTYTLAVSVIGYNYTNLEDGLGESANNGAVYLYSFSLDWKRERVITENGIPTTNGTQTAIIISTHLDASSNFGDDILWAPDGIHLAIQTAVTPRTSYIYNSETYLLMELDKTSTNEAVSLMTWDVNDSFPKLFITDGAKIYIYNTDEKYPVKTPYKTVSPPITSPYTSGIQTFATNMVWSYDGLELAVSSKLTGTYTIDSTTYGKGIVTIYNYKDNELVPNSLIKNNINYKSESIDVNSGSLFGDVMAWAPKSPLLLISNVTGGNGGSGEVFAYI